MQSIKTMTSKDLEAEFGRCITDIELAKYINVDVRTLRKYADRLGGVMVIAEFIAFRPARDASDASQAPRFVFKFVFGIGRLYVK